MVEYNLNRIFHALADPTRRAVLRRIVPKTCTVSELARPFNMSLAAISKHIGVLEQAQLLIREKHGRQQHCRLNPQALACVAKWLQFYQRFWQGQLDALDQFLNAVNKQGNDHDTQ